MALTQGAWTYRTERGLAVFQCDVVQTASENDAYTLALPEQFDGNRPFTVIANAAAATLDGSTLPVDIYVGYQSNFAITGDAATIAATSGVLLIADVIADVKSAAGAYSYDPRNTAAAANAPYFAFNLDGASTLTAGTCRWIVIQGAAYPKS